MKSSNCNNTNQCDPIDMQGIAQGIAQSIEQGLDSQMDPRGHTHPAHHHPPFSLKFLFTIVDRGKGQGVVDLLSHEGVLFHTIMRGWGTAHKDILAYLGLGETEKDVVLSALRADKGSRALRKLMHSMQLDGPGRGISFSVPITSVGGGRTLAYLKGAFEGKDEKELALKHEVNEMEHHEHEHSLIVTIINNGFSDQVVDAANGAGARGGTVLHARGAGMQEAEKFFGITIQPEKEVVLTLVRDDQRQEIMRAICREAGMSSPGHGFSFSLPVEDVMGMARIVEEMDEVDE